MASDIPRAFGAGFLTWFRERTKATWSTYPAQTLERFEERKVFGCDWQPRTRGLGGLAEGYVAAAEHDRERHRGRSRRTTASTEGVTGAHPPGSHH
jgi:hypothetical protein